MKTSAKQQAKQIIMKASAVAKAQIIVDDNAITVTTGTNSDGDILCWLKISHPDKKILLNKQHIEMLIREINRVKTKIS